MAVVGNINDYMRMRRGEASLTQNLSLPSNAHNILNEIRSVEDVIARAEQESITLIPFDIEGFVLLFGIIIKPDMNMDIETSGYVTFDNTQKQWIIGVNDSQSSTRRRFTIAHELAHIILHGNLILSEGIHRDKGLFRDADYMSAIEKEANDFAGKLLMPENKILELVQNGTKKSDLLAAIFDVSQSAIKYRLNQCGLSWIK
ncbi:MAG: ImmA/IrrE family metallo-endopeptidase [Bacteroidetes bacterium]|nr:ImmA/IrrE family metallo-endopeptidase [Bacteroidota bacterium]